MSTFETEKILLVLLYEKVISLNSNLGCIYKLYNGEKRLYMAVGPKEKLAWTNCSVRSSSPMYTAP